MAGFLDTSELDFESYKNSLKAYLKGQDKFRDMDFDGSNMAVLIELLARNTYHNGFYLNMVGSEAFLDTAQLRESVVSRAKELNYVPRSRSASVASVNIRVNAPDSPSLITVPKFYTMSSASSEGSFIFSTDEAVVLTSDGGFYIANNVPVFEGRVVTEYFVASATTRYNIASPNIDIRSLQVNITASQSDTANSDWNRAYNLYGLDETANVYFVQGAASDRYEVVFGNGVTGRALAEGNIVKITYRDCSGVEGDGYSRFQKIGNIDGYSDITITLADGISSHGGAERETLNSVKFNAPRHFASQERAVTKGDYIALIRAQFPQIESIAVFGGEELEQKRYGKVVIVIKPYGAEAAPDALKNLVQSYISQRTSVAIDPVFIDPDFFYIDVKSLVSYDPSLTSKSVSALKVDILNAIAAFSAGSLTDFASDLRLSRLISAIDNADPSIVSNDTTIRAIKRISPKRDTEQAFVIEFKSALKKSLDKKTITSSTFYHYHVSTDKTYLAFIQDDGNGRLGIFTRDITGSTPTPLHQRAVGTVDYNTGKMQLTDLKVVDYDGYISIYAELAQKDFLVQQNQIILIDPDDVDINISKAQF